MTAVRTAVSPVVLFAGLVAAPAAVAHSLSVSHLDIRPAGDSSTVVVGADLSLRDLALTLPIDLDRDDRITWGELQSSGPAIEQLLREGLRLSDASGPCPWQVERMGVRRYDDGAYAGLLLRSRCDINTLRLDYRLFFAQDPQHRALATLHREDGVRTAILTVEAPQLTMSKRSGTVFPTFMREGWRHILSGYDHLAFLLCLVLPAGLTRAGGQWLPVATARAGLLRVAGLATAFTLAHSVTLSLAALEWVTPASRLVEIGIVLSILLAALNLLWPVVHRRLWLLTFGFGLVHGLGFAGALLEVGLPAGSRALALVGFNIGVELGQLAVILAVVPCILAMRRKRWYAGKVMPLMAIAITLLAVVWLVQRVAA